LSASAGFTIDQAGDSTAEQVYRSFVYGGLGADGTFAFPNEAFTGVNYLDNIAPLPYATANGSFTADGATLSINGWSAYSGFYASRNYASMTVTNANPNHVYYVVAGQGTSTSLRFFTEEAAQARAEFTWRVDGVQTNGNPNGLGRAEPRLDFHATTEAGRSWFDLFNGGFGSTPQFGQGSFTFSLPVAPVGDAIYLHYWASAFTELQAGQATAGGSFTMTADFGHTYVLENVRLFDENDNPLSSYAVVDNESGEMLFNQSGRLADVLAAPPVPEPQTYALWLLGLAGLAAWRRRVP
jgi:MYXO-CTERM domain-containing protein